MYNRRVFLAAPHLPSTSTVVCYEGPPGWHDKDRPALRDKFLEVSNCHNSIRLHQVDAETDIEFIDKLKKLHTELGLFINYLESDECGSEVTTIP